MIGNEAELVVRAGRYVRSYSEESSGTRQNSQQQSHKNLQINIIIYETYPTSHKRQFASFACGICLLNGLNGRSVCIDKRAISFVKCLLMQPFV